MGTFPPFSHPFVLCNLSCLVRCLPLSALVLPPSPVIGTVPPTCPDEAVVPGRRILVWLLFLNASASYISRLRRSIDASSVLGDVGSASCWHAGMCLSVLFLLRPCTSR